MKFNNSKVYLGNDLEHFEKEGMKNIPESWEDGQRVPIDRRHFEWWYFDAELDDGSILVIIFGPKPFFDTHFPIYPVVVIDYTDPTGKQIQEFYFEKNWKKNYSSSKEKCEVRVKGNYIIGDLKKYKIKAVTKTINVEINLESISPPWRPGNGFLYFQKKGKSKEKYFAWFPSVPFGKISGKLSINGIQKKVKGYGYHDHNWGNADPSSLFNHWYWSRSHIGNYVLLACDLIAGKDYNFEKMPYLLLLNKKGILADDVSKLSITHYQPEIHPKTKKIVSKAIEFKYDDEKLKFILTLQRKKDLVLQNLILMNSPHLFVNQVGKNPWYHRILGDSKLVLEKDGQKEYYESTVVYELMYYGKNLSE
ncbi:MAG: hypothetical protein JXA54_00060 [Candidatus Heimdallarchaeota archaeon]|nr:hypothetical protein [Candidatus Heimdallarchaeota archaeon]